MKETSRITLIYDPEHYYCIFRFFIEGRGRRGEKGGLEEVTVADDSSREREKKLNCTGNGLFSMGICVSKLLGNIRNSNASRNSAPPVFRRFRSRCLPSFAGFN
ncbi:hypothetical protein GWI33_004211 [Rhynchophorus ferrugineus]|uniref:Uncharacterized protein n=1 Tax=Rhynchophorus ferrugineus TaxID=354439 RepID=A0A834IVE3_RHYFE|nr:hypothetical protein GWI33_004211 [Rhynchophorus ferrugineus]